ncbi:MAG: helix-turn-helix domain-containing protein [Aquabacterium sp.]|nr:helix-turn-helix domain-containing protein [Aquabacterium sp.]
MVEVCKGNLSEAARRLGISRNTLYRKLGKPAADGGPAHTRPEPRAAALHQ